MEFSYEQLYIALVAWQLIKIWLAMLFTLSIIYIPSAGIVYGLKRLFKIQRKWILAVLFTFVTAAALTVIFVIGHSNDWP